MIQLLICLCILLFTSAAQSAESVSLQRCYDWAQTQSETIKMLRENIVQSDSKAQNAFSGIWPDLSWRWTNLWQDPQGVNTLNNQGLGGFAKNSQMDSAMSFKQPLFSGLKEFSAHSGFLKEKERDALLLQNASRDLFENTALRFYDVLLSESNLNNTRLAWELAEMRLKELETFHKIGKARNSEVFASQAQVASLRAQTKQSLALVLTAREELNFLTGQNLSETTLEETASPGQLKSLNEYLEKIDLRKDIQAQKKDAEARKYQIRYERGAYFPSLDLLGNYYTQRSSFFSEINWDLGLTINVPLYQGGAVAAKVREAESWHRQSLLRLQEMRRSVQKQTRTLYGQLQNSLEETNALDEAATSAEKSYEALRKEYRSGLVTNLEVLQALDSLQTQKSARDAARLKSHLLWLRLQTVVGELP